MAAPTSGDIELANQRLRQSGTSATIVQVAGGFVALRGRFNNSADVFAAFSIARATVGVQWILPVSDPKVTGFVEVLNPDATVPQEGSPTAITTIIPSEQPPPAGSNASDTTSNANTPTDARLTPILRDYHHGAKTFTADNFRLLPKQAYLFHVFIDINPAALLGSTLVSAPSQRELSLMVKSVDLPKFTFDTKTFNAYNRPNVIQTKVKYDPVVMSFHDDSAEVVNKFWYDYYSYYYRDSDHSDPLYGVQSKYSQRISQSWGYSPRNTTSTTPRPDIPAGVPYINSIKIYSFHQKRFSEYTLFNPIITSWTHGKHAVDSKDSLDNSMSVSYESIKYAEGTVSAATVHGFGDTLHYDVELSPNGDKLSYQSNSLTRPDSTFTEQRLEVSAQPAPLAAVPTVLTTNLARAVALSQQTQNNILVPVADIFNNGIIAAPASIQTVNRTIT